MATYEEIYGKRVKDFDSDPTLDSSYEGQVWYNSATGTLKSVVSFASWSSSSDALYPAYNTSGFGVQTASVFIAGSYPNYNNNTQEYNGSGFSAGGAYPESRSGIGTAGILTAGLAWGGNSSPEFESQLTNEYNGTSWTNVNNYPITVAFPAGAGTQTAGLGAGGWDYSGPFSAKNTTNEYDGTNWTGSNNLNTARSSLFGGGTQTAAIMAGGDKFTPGTASDNSGACEEYNGTSWTSVNSLPGTTNGAGGRTTNAVQTDFRILSGASGTAFTSPYVKNYEYDGTNWAAGPNYTTARYGAAGSGTGPAAIITGGRTPSYVLTTEEFNKSINTITAAAWASGGAYPAAFQGGIGFGLQTAAVGAGGTPSPTFNLKTFEYDGSSWTAGNDMARASGSPYTSAYSSGSGTLTAGWAAGGGYPSPNALTENYNGTNWTASAAMPANRRGGNCSGPQTAGLFFGGFAPPQVNTTYEYDGEGWTTGGAMGTARSNAGGSHVNASQTAGLAFAGNSPSQTSNVEEYNGTAWSEVNNYPISVSYVGYAGTQTDAIGFMGYTSPGPSFVTTFGYDGTSWSTRPNASTSRLNYHNNAGTAAAALVFGGEGSSGNVSSTEEFTGVTETVTAKTLTTS